MINFNCTNCGQNLDAPTNMAMQDIDCPACGAPLIVPAAPVAAPTRPAPRAPQKPKTDPAAKAGHIVLGVAAVVLILTVVIAITEGDRLSAGGGITLAGILSFVAFVLSIVVLARGRTREGLKLLFFSIFLIPFFFMLLSMIVPLFRR